MMYFRSFNCVVSLFLLVLINKIGSLTSSSLKIVMIVLDHSSSCMSSLTLKRKSCSGRSNVPSKVSVSSSPSISVIYEAHVSRCSPLSRINCLTWSKM
jgi:hypothetical protein